MRLFHCSQCAQRVFFENTACENCGSRLGYVPAEGAMVAFRVDGDAPWSRLGPEGPAQRPCVNYVKEGVCNWMVGPDEDAARCVSCRTTEVIPALTSPENRRYWGRLEQAKRQLFFTLISLSLPVPDRKTDPAHGMAFRFLAETDPKVRVLTGHHDGVITLNIAEANDAFREQTRLAMQEPYRSLVGHYRHESGHFYWDRMVEGTPWIDECRALFGDERRNYEKALKEHYRRPVADWQLSYVSAYASSHPWEDWAECWAHYLHMIDGLETAAAWGLRLDQATPGSGSLQAAAVDVDLPSIEASLIGQWLPVARFNNAMNRSLGLQDSYPFVVPSPVVAKLDFIHRVVRAGTHGEVPMNFSPVPGKSIRAADESEEGVDAAASPVPFDAGHPAALRERGITPL